MGQTHENDKKKFIIFVKSNQLEKSFRNIAVEGQYSILIPRVLCYHFIMLSYGSMVYHPYGTRVVLYQNGYQSTGE